MTRYSSFDRFTAVAVALILPPLLTYLLSSLVLQHGLDMFSVLLVQAIAFAFAVIKLRPHAGAVVLCGVLYFPLMFVLNFWIGYVAGYYDLP
jgi:hypothetical protein